ncbi:GntR family transcriptional regulator [Robertmurraya siralis]|uniref:GntR family transcriptional regulator n=1 Tax=Robertmurraya siralis TaxID=77777 RepID=A0A920BV65_9BACI|nr:PLP-dependent aminotransferase family protein [Robertmurraya siralis]GIN63799.1 GntR family transcriptional regulator [Robertmurraya siralis]
MKIEINRNANIPINQQIYENIADRIRSGALSEGEHLPSVRSLAKQLGISLLTVVRVYDLLEEKDLIERVQGKGTFVKNKLLIDATERNVKNNFDWQLSVLDYLPRTQFGAHYGSFENCIQFSVAAICPSLLPNRYLEREIHSTLKKNPNILSSYGPAQGDEELRKTMCKYLRKHNLYINHQDILVTNGTQQGIDLVAKTFIGPGDVVAMEAPTYPAAIDTFRARGATIVPLPMDNDGIRIDHLQRVCEIYKPKLIYTIPNFQNPTGIVLSRKRREQLLMLAQENQIIIVEDDPWSEMFFDKKPPTPIKGLDTNGFVIYLKGLSKTLVPGCRIGLLAANGTLFNRLVASKVNTDLGSPLLTQKAILPLFHSKRMEDHMEKLRFALNLRKDKVVKLLNSHMPDGVHWIVPTGGLNIWLSVPSEWNTNHLLIECKKENIFFLPGSACFSGEPEKHHLRLNFTYLPDNELEMGILKFCKITKKFLSSNRQFRHSSIN